MTRHPLLCPCDNCDPLHSRPVITRADWANLHRDVVRALAWRRRRVADGRLLTAFAVVVVERLAGPRP